MAVSKIKLALASLLRMSGWLTLLSYSLMRKRAAILMYHRVLPHELSTVVNVPVHPGMYVTPKSLRSHLSWLKLHFQILSLSELGRRLTSGQDISRCIVITFDDGWRDNYQYAFPLLQEFNVPAAIFLASGFIGTLHRFWPDEVAWTVLAVLAKRIDVSLVPNLLAEIMKCKPIGNVQPLEEVDRIIAAMKTWDEVRRVSVAQGCTELREKADAGGERLMMNWKEVREMAAGGLVEFGSHTVSHALLDQVPVETVRRELVGSVTRIHKETTLPVRLFAYPNGNYNATVLSTLPGSGIEVAVTTRRGLVQPDSPLLELPRIGVHEDVSKTLPLLQWRLFIQ